MKQFWQKKKLFEPVNGLSLAVFRIMFGVLLTYTSLKYVLHPDYLYQNYYTSPITFKYQFFEWVQLWPQPWMAELHFQVMTIAILFATAGIFYRLSIIVFTLLFTYFFLLEETYYLNHYYLAIIIAVVLCFVPANRCLSVDRLIRTDWDDNVPRWSVWSLRTLTEIVLIYAGVAKLNSDWLQLEPLGTWLRTRTSMGRHIFGDVVFQDWFIALGAYGTIALHLCGAPLLFFKRTRLWVFIVYCIFHALNSYTFNIGIFPYLTAAATLIFFEPEWPKTLFNKLRKPFSRIRAWLLKSGKWRLLDPALSQKLAFGTVVVWLVIQALLPLRHFLYPGNVSWTEEGHQYAWHMKLRDKQGTLIAFHVRDPVSGETWLVDPGKYLNFRQSVGFRGQPDMLLQFAYYLEEVWRNRGYQDVEVYCESYVSLNGRPPVLLVDPNVDLTTKKWDLKPADWIMPLDQPLLHWKDPARPNLSPLKGTKE